MLRRGTWTVTADSAVDIILVRGDITMQHVDAVVNAANSSLLGGGGVDGAIHRRGGPAILAACQDLRAGDYGGGLPAGQAVATTGGDLPARWVIHTVGPVYSASEDRSAVLASCYAESLRVAVEPRRQHGGVPGDLYRRLRVADGRCGPYRGAGRAGVAAPTGTSRGAIRAVQR